MSNNNIPKIIDIKDLFFSSDMKYQKKMKLLHQQIGHTNSFMCEGIKVNVLYQDDFDLEDLLENYLRHLKRDFKNDE